jgi:glycerophosphoryl diester phosphodiesterase
MTRRRARGPLVIAHRGASGERPEHTLAAYRRAIAQGADFIEPDLVSSSDGVLVVRHENEIGGTTDVAAHPALAARRTTKQIDGREVSGFFCEDFSWAELSRLRARERLPELRPRNTAYDGALRIARLEDVLRLAQAESRRRGRVIGVYPETKHPTYFAEIGLPLEATLVRTLHRHGYHGRTAPVFIQSFEVGNLQRLRGLTDLPLVQLVDATGQPFDLQSGGDARGYAELISPAGLAEIARYADAIGVHKALIVPRTADGRSQAPSALIEQAHAAGLAVHAWTFRNENAFLASELRRAPLQPGTHGDATSEYAQFFALGLDAVFSDYPGTAVAARDRYSWRQR